MPALSLPPSPVATERVERFWDRQRAQLRKEGNKSKKKGKKPREKWRKVGKLIFILFPDLH